MFQIIFNIIKSSSTIVYFIMLCFSIIPEESFANRSIDSGNIDSIYDNLINLSIPVVSIITVDGEEPTFEQVSAPDGLWGKSITNATKVPSRIKIFKEGNIIYDSGDYEKKKSGCTIKVRGNTSTSNKKKSYKIKLQNKADLLCREDIKYQDKDWILLRQGSSLNTTIGFWLCELLNMDYTPAHEYVNLFINSVYKGVYILTESVSVNNACRIQFEEESGYLIEYDAYFWNEEQSFPSKIGHPNMQFTYKYPDIDDVTEEINEVIQNDIYSIEESIINGTYPDYLDLKSFAKWLLAWDIMGGGDAGGANIFLMKENINDKLKMGPLWDFDYAFYRNDFADIHSQLFYFKYLFNSDNLEFSKYYSDLWYNQGREVINKINEKLIEFSSSKEGIDYETSLLYESLDKNVNNDWSQIDEIIKQHYGNLTEMKDFITNYLLRKADRLDFLIPKNTSNVSIIGKSSNSLNNDIMLDISGLKSSNLFKGIKIHNGKKIYIIR